MRHAGKRIVSTVCALAMLAAMLPAQAMATGKTEPDTSVQQELPETETGAGTDASKVSGQEGVQNSGEKQDDLNGGENQDDQTPDEKEKEPAAEGGETDLSEDEKDENSTGADLSGDDTTEADGSRKPADDENGGSSQNGQNGGAVTLEEPASGETENGNGETETTPQADGDVARIGNKTYATLDEAIKDAADGATIELLADAVTSGISIKNLNLSIKSAEGITTPLKITFNKWGIHAVNSTLTFSNVIVDMTVSSHPEIEGNTANLIDDSNLILVSSQVSIKNDHSDPGGESAIYLYQGSNLYVQDGSSLEISGFNDTKQDSGIYADGSERDDSLPHFQIQISNSSMISIQNCGWAGLTVNPCDITVSGDSRLTVAKCGANGGKQGLGCYYGKLTVMDHSEVNVSENPGAYWGIFIKDLKVDKTSSLIANDNTGDGIAIGGEAEISSGATIKASHNGDAGMRVYVSGETWAGNVTIKDGAKAEFIGNGAAGISNSNHLVVEKGADVTITGNKVSGIRNNSNATATLDGNVKIEENQGSGIYNLGGTLTMNAGTIMNNSTTTYGGGVYNTGTLTLSDNVRIYNNHAKNPSNNSSAGDDIFNNTTATITFGKVGSNWNLDDCKNDEGNTVEGCTAGGVIDGWYDDAENNRWDAHDGDGDCHAVEFTEFGASTGLATITGLRALKAAHGITATIQPAEITIYMGGEGYSSVVEDASGTETPDGSDQEEVGQKENGLPEPGFFITLPDDINALLRAADPDLDEGDIGTKNLTEYITKIYAVTTDDDSRAWDLVMYGATQSNARNGKFVYRIEPIAAGQDPVRLQFTDEEGTTFYTSDNFDPVQAGALHTEYTMGIYPGLVDTNQIKLDIQIGGETYTCTVKLEESTLNIRYVTGKQEDVVTGLGTGDIGEMKKEEDKAYAAVPANTIFTINEGEVDVDVDVTDGAAPSLLFDDVVSGRNTEDVPNYDEQLADAALETIDENELTDPQYEAKYLDLVDANNGNVWLKASNAVTVSWPYPEGTDENTTFYLVHFEGMHRGMEYAQMGEQMKNAVEVENLEKTDHGIQFTTTSFSPFVLMWENPAEQPSGGSGSEENPAPTATPQPTPAPAEAEPVAAPAAAPVPQTSDDMPIALLGVSAAGAAVVFVALLAVRKRRHGKD